VHNGISGHPLALAPGTNRVCCTVPRLPLAPGTYQLDCHAYASDETLFWAPHVGELTIAPSDFYETGKLPQQEWAGFCLLEQSWVVEEARR
jgi:hypothetical protein